MFFLIQKEPKTQGTKCVAMCLMPAHDSPRQRIHHDVHTESSIINTVKSLVSKIIVPLAAIVLVTVQDSDLIIDFYRFQVVMNNIIAPTIEFLRSRGRPIKFEEHRI